MAVTVPFFALITTRFFPVTLLPSYMAVTLDPSSEDDMDNCFLEPLRIVAHPCKRRIAAAIAMNRIV